MPPSGRPAFLLLGLLLGAGCADSLPSEDVIDGHYVIRRIGVDPVSEFGVFLEALRFLAPSAIDAIENTRCDGATPIAIEVTGARQGRTGVGRVRFQFVPLIVPAEECASTNDPPGPAIALDPSAPSAEGPLLFGPTSADGRISLEPFFADTLLGGLWFEIAGRFHPGTTVFDSGRMSADIPAVRLHTEQVDGWGASYLDVLANADYQPDVDVDGDGLERFYDDPFDADYRVDRCETHGATGVQVNTGTDCPEAPGFVDAYRFGVLFRLGRAHLVED